MRYIGHILTGDTGTDNGKSVFCGKCILPRKTKMYYNDKIETCEICLTISLGLDGLDANAPLNFLYEERE